MSVLFESATRLNALKSKIDTETGVTSQTLAKAVENALARIGKEVYEGTVTLTTGSINTGVTLQETDIFIAVPGNATIPSSNATTKRTSGIVYVPGKASYLITIEVDDGALKILHPSADISYSGTNVIFSLPTTSGAYMKWYVIR